MSKLIAKLIFGIIKLIFRDKTDLVLENLALRHQLSVLERKKSQNLKVWTVSFGPGYQGFGQECQTWILLSWLEEKAVIVLNIRLPL